MRIFYSLPKEGELFQHDSPLLKVIGLGLLSFILLSSVTVFTGFILHFSLKGMELVFYGIGIYPLLCLAPDLIDLACFSWVVRTILLWKRLPHSSVTSSILLSVCLGISGLCTWFSFNLSQISAQQLADWLRPETTIHAQVDSAFQDRAFQILAMDSLSAQGKKQVFDASKSAAIQVYDNQIRSLAADSLQWEKDRRPSNTLWVNKQLAPIKENLRRLRYDRDTTLLNLNGAYQLTADSSTRVRDQVTALILDDTQQALKRKQAKQNRMDHQHDFIRTLISAIAGYAVIIVLILGGIREILYFRNDIQPRPVIGPFDFQNMNHLKEVAALPFAAAGRVIINQVRRWYEALPDLEDPAVDGFAYEYGGKTRIKKLNGKSQDSLKKMENENGATGSTNNGTAAAHNSAATVENKLKHPNGAVSNGPVTVETIIEKDNTIRNCVHCGQVYKIRSFNQKFCSGDCKEAYHAERHQGQKFKPNMYHKQKK